MGSVVTSIRLVLIGDDEPFILRSLAGDEDGKSTRSGTSSEGLMIIKPFSLRAILQEQ